MYTGFHVTCLLHLSDLTKIMIRWQILVTIRNVNFRETVPWESLHHVGRWLGGQTWQGSQPLSANASYLHLTMCDLFFQNHVIFKYRQVHFQSQLLKTLTPSSLPHKSDTSVIPVCAQTCHVCFMDGVHTIRHLDTAARSIFTLTFHPPISLQSPVTVWACAKYQDYYRCNMNVDRLT